MRSSYTTTFYAGVTEGPIWTLEKVAWSPAFVQLHESERQVTGEDPGFLWDMVTALLSDPLTLASLTRQAGVSKDSARKYWSTLKSTVPAMWFPHLSEPSLHLCFSLNGETDQVVQGEQPHILARVTVTDLMSESSPALATIYRRMLLVRIREIVEMYRLCDGLFDDLSGLSPDDPNYLKKLFDSAGGRS